MAHPSACKCMGVFTVLSSSISMNYMLALSIEVVIKLRKGTHSYFKLRKVLYHAISVGFAVFLVVLAEIHGDYGSSDIKTCSLAPKSLTESIRLSSFAIDIILMWLLIGYMLGKVGKTYSNVIFNYFLVIFSMTLSVTIVNLLGFSEDFDLKNPTIYSQIALLIGTTTGISIGLSRLANRRLLKQIFWKFGIKKKRISKLTSSSIFEQSDSLVNQNIYNLADLFENLEKKKLMQILAVISMRFSDHSGNSFSLENEAEYDQYEFDEDLFERLSIMYEMPKINESIFLRSL